jgi:hypothetical protein
MTEKKEMSQLARQLLGSQGAVTFFTQQEFDDALTIAKAEIMTVAIETTKQALMIEREACADIARDAGQPELAEKILSRIPAQRQ